MTGNCEADEMQSKGYESFKDLKIDLQKKNPSLKILKPQYIPNGFRLESKEETQKFIENLKQQMKGISQ